jgi:hypothetical protein
VGLAPKRDLKPRHRNFLNFFTVYIALPLIIFSLSFIFWPILGLAILPKFYQTFELGKPVLEYELIIICCFVLKTILSIIAFFVPEIVGRTNNLDKTISEKNISGVYPNN